MRLVSRVGLLACVALAAPARVHAPLADAPDVMRGAARPVGVRIEVADRRPASVVADRRAGVTSTDAALLIGWTGDTEGERR